MLKMSTFVRRLDGSQDTNSSCVPWRSMGRLFLLALGISTLYIASPFGEKIDNYLFSILGILYLSLITGLCLHDSFFVARRLRMPSGDMHAGKRFSPLLIGLHVGVFLLAQIVFTLSFVYQGQEPPFASLTYEIILGVYPFLIGAILLLPARKVSLPARLRILLDSLIIIVLAATLFAYFVLAPILSQGEGSGQEKVIGTLFLVLDLVVLFCILLVALRFEEVTLRPVMLLLLLSSFSMLSIHISRLYLVLTSQVHWFSYITLWWLFGLIFTFGAAQTLKNILVKTSVSGQGIAAYQEHSDELFSTSRGESLVSLIMVLSVCALIFALWLVGSEKIFRGDLSIIYVGGFALLMLVVLRQLLALYEIGVLQNKLQKRNRSLSLLNDLLEQQAITDSLTGLPNHRELVGRLEEALEEARKTASTCGLIFLDLDHFKDINDRYGHLVGDAVLCECSERVSASLRASDYLGRWGGEEFVAILPGVEPGEALGVAEKIRATIAQDVFADEVGVRLTCSLGVATYPHDAANREDLIKNADRAMYTAKRLGRDQTRMASEPLVLAMGMLVEAPETPREAEMLAVVESLIAALEARDHATGQHGRRVAALSLKLALALGCHWSEACIIGMGGLMHDLGKVAMPDSILFKRGKLNTREIEYMARHPVIGEEILTALPAFQDVAEVVRNHHEWFNGAGYPDGLSGEQIPLGARIVAVADAYDAIISHRVYRQGRGSYEAARELRKGAGGQFDPRVVNALDQMLAASPRLAYAAGA